MKYIVRNCPEIKATIFTDGKHIDTTCLNSFKGEFCADIENCAIKKVVRKLLKTVENDQCSSCDGVGYFAGCLDNNCGVYNAFKCLQILNVVSQDNKIKTKGKEKKK